MCLPDASVGGMLPAAGTSDGVAVLCPSDMSTLYLPDAGPVDEEGPAVLPEPCQVGL